MESILELKNKVFDLELSNPNTSDYESINCNRYSDPSSSEDSETSISDTTEQRYLKWLRARRKDLTLGVFVIYPRGGYE